VLPGRLVEHSGETVTKEHLLKIVWPDTFVDEANLRVHMGAVRKALHDGNDDTGRHDAPWHDRQKAKVEPETRRSHGHGGKTLRCALHKRPADRYLDGDVPQFACGCLKFLEIF
jgi:hypothetical protein